MGVTRMGMRTMIEPEPLIFFSSPFCLSSIELTGVADSSSEPAPYGF